MTTRTTRSDKEKTNKKPLPENARPDETEGAGVSFPEKSPSEVKPDNSAEPFRPTESETPHSRDKGAPPAFIGKYKLIREIGKGATATVYLVSDPETGGEFALKLIRFRGENEAMSRRLRKLFQTEGAIGRRLKHPNIVRIFDARIEADRAYIVMEYVDCVSLETFCTINNLLPLHRVIGIVFKCCLALDYAFRQGVVHRDIKPANILLDKEDNPKIADFGLALNVRKDVSNDSTFVMGVGSPAYMSPEQVKNYPLNHKTDLYSLGVVLFQLLTGRLPFRATAQGALVYKIINQEIPSVCALNPNLPAGLDPIIQKALEKDLYSRYRNGADFAKDLSAVRYQIMEEDSTERDTSHFRRLRRMHFFAEFDDIEIWELLRTSVWRNYAARIRLIREGDKNRFFGVLLKGNVEVSLGGKSLVTLGPGEVIGEMAFLHPRDMTRTASVVTLEPCKFLEINCSAFELSSEELQERFRKVLIAKVLDRLRNANQALAKFGKTATKGAGGSASMEIEPLDS
ncbi:MAG: protein kinase [Candidatus Accumulibacter sp.]|jgi:non-specific serine/threonine protein kinase|nr:protein kinase [Accumulibacter sp.]